MKKLVKLFLTLVVASTLVACGSKKVETATYKDGTYTASADGMNGAVEVEVVIADGKIEAVTVVSESETEGIKEAAIDALPTEIVEKQSADVDTVSGATMTSKAIIEAVKVALAEASK